MLFSLQADIETLRDELEFKNHKIDEYENMLQAERYRVKDLGQELQVLNPYQYYYYYCCLVTIFSYYMALLRLENRNISAGKHCSRQVTSLINNDNNRYRRRHHHDEDNNNNYYNDDEEEEDDDDDV